MSSTVHHGLSGLCSHPFSSNAALSCFPAAGNLPKQLARRGFSTTLSPLPPGTHSVKEDVLGLQDLQKQLAWLQNDK